MYEEKKPCTLNQVSGVGWHQDQYQVAHAMNFGHKGRINDSPWRLPYALHLQRQDSLHQRRTPPPSRNARRISYHVIAFRETKSSFPSKDGIDHEEIPHQSLLLVNTHVKPRYSQWRNATTDSTAEVRAAIQTMKAATAPGPDLVSVDLLRAGEHRPHKIFAGHLTCYLQKERTSGDLLKQSFFIRAMGKIFRTTVQYGC
ncbi:unnamed protein product [Strongylus vulgaris]|uniref:Uncharacterized protein n=1 Tax=Strongylus vulgaris TaxID=40348 RepID=A0A3P7JXA5_STRVU|nr:unnamed protein product [Strongylus vulgaris]